jgi:hypothetical protein
MAMGRSQMAKQVSKSGSSKDACYHKVKARYRVFPSAYASGAIAKCRKVGAANYGKSTKKKAYGGMIESDQPRKRSLPRGFKNGASVIIARGCGTVEGRKRKKTRIF